MHGLFGGELAPVTFSWGFVEAPFDLYCENLLAWWNYISIEFEAVTVDEDVRCALRRLEPLQTPQNRYLVLDTKSRWTAVFNNGLRTSDLAGPVGHLSDKLNCRGLEISCIPDRSYVNQKDAVRTFGSVSFKLFGPGPTDWLNRIRTVAAMNDGGKWIFISEGLPQPYEDQQQYQKRKIVDRFTCEMLRAYCEALDIKLFDPGFYGTHGLLVNQLTKFPQVSPQMSIREAQSHLYLSKDDDQPLNRKQYGS
jgi:hypothetical protein